MRHLNWHDLGWENQSWTIWEVQPRTATASHPACHSLWWDNQIWGWREMMISDKLGETQFLCEYKLFHLTSVSCMLQLQSIHFILSPTILGSMWENSLSKSLWGEELLLSWQGGAPCPQFLQGLLSSPHQILHCLQVHSSRGSSDLQLPNMRIEMPGYFGPMWGHFDKPRRIQSLCQVDCLFPTSTCAFPFCSTCFLPRHPYPPIHKYWCLTYTRALSLFKNYAYW